MADLFDMETCEDGKLNEEELFLLSCIKKNNFLGLPISPGLGVDVCFDKNILKKWKSEAMIGKVIDDFPFVLDDIACAKKIDFGDKLQIMNDCKSHDEARDFIDEKSLGIFTYLNTPLHQRRIMMLADLAVLSIRNKLKEKNKVVFLNFGPGLFPWEKEIISRLSEKERKRVDLIAVDVNEQLLRFGLYKGYIDKGMVLDVTKCDDFKKIEADIVGFAEILEHIKNGVAVFDRTMVSWLRDNFSTLIGSVPNHIQLHEFVGLISNTSVPHQIEVSSFNPVSGHVCPYTYASLVKALKMWGFSSFSIASNGIRLGRGNNALLNKPEVPGDRLIFFAGF